MKLKFFDLAKKLSKKSSHPQYKLGCVIVRGNEIVSIGFNQLKTHPKSVTPYKQLHAEINAVLSADKKDLSNCEVYVYREHHDGSLALSKPCQYCQAVLESVGIEKVYYTHDNGFRTINV
jgi:deoxycytidylate deaminase